MPKQTSAVAEGGKNGRPAVQARARQDSAMKRFEEHVDRENLLEFLADNEGSGEKFRMMAAMMLDPAYARMRLATIARKCRISLAELQQVYTDGMRHIGMLQMATALPQVMADVAEDALSKTQVCPRCDGLAATDSDVDCPICEGKGQIRVAGDKHARDLVFEAMKLTKNGGPLVAVTQNFGRSAAEEKMESMLKMTQTIVMGKESQDAGQSYSAEGGGAAVGVD